MIATSDIAAAAFKAVTGTPPKGVKVTPLLGPKDYSFEEATTIIGNKLGRKVTFVRATPEQTREALIGMGASTHMADNLIEMYDAMEKGYLKPEIDRTQESTTDTTLDEFVEKLMLPALKTV
jgi:uncharacterized protein YbjT (DUF2867 family)